ncbi:MAG: class I SAM-dependent methyltransferase [Leptospiraceae bacterium]|nr:class I SAM-dependent methyltransferase [Leptospiraceae bacterium]MCP5496792.1 class I SAM-dependent methyltransferase [Leptospiraceae bacterium]
MKHSVLTSAANGLAFDKKYWKTVYRDEIDIDGTYNSKDHARYIASLFTLCEIEVYSMADFGFGKANLLEDFVKLLKPDKVYAIEPSWEMVDKLSKSRWISGLDISIIHSSIQDFTILNIEQNPLDFTICNSVFQYIGRDIENMFQKLSRITKYLYFSVPTDKDYDRMKKELGFNDPYAYQRPLHFYMEALKPHFTVVSFNLLESKCFDSTGFPDELYRF